MGDSILKEFIERYNKDKEELDKKFEHINSKIGGIENKFDNMDNRLNSIDKKLLGIDEMQRIVFGSVSGLSEKLGNIKLFLSSIETKLNEYRALHIQGHKVIDGEMYILKIELQKIKPIINWENDEFLLKKYNEINENVIELEEKCRTA